MSGEQAVPPPWTAGQVARRLGIAESTLRAWHRRYGVDPQAARPGGYRRYTEADFARLRRMRDLIRSGVLPSEAAREAGGSLPAPRSPDELLAELLAATRDLDGVRCRALLVRALLDRGVVPVWEQVCRPALAAVDGGQDGIDGCAEANGCVDNEHALSWAITAALHRVETGPADPGRPAVLLTCTDAEQHTLALEALAAALAERRVPVRMLGAAVPVASVLHAVTTARPAAVVLWAQRPETADIRAVRALRPFSVRRVTAGPGWPGPVAGAEHVATLAAAVALLTASD